MNSTIRTSFVVLAAGGLIFAQPDRLSGQIAPGRYDDYGGEYVDENYGTAASVYSRQQKKAEREHGAATSKLIVNYGKTSGPSQRARVRKQLSIVVGKHFDARQDSREKELKQLEAQVRRLRELHIRRLSAKSDIVKARVEQLLRQADGLG